MNIKDLSDLDLQDDNFYHNTIRPLILLLLKRKNIFHIDNNWFDISSSEKKCYFCNQSLKDMYSTKIRRHGYNHLIDSKLLNYLIPLL